MMLAAWIAYKLEISRFPANYLRDHCGVEYQHIRYALPVSIDYIVDQAVELVKNPPLLVK